MEKEISNELVSMSPAFLVNYFTGRPQNKKSKVNRKLFSVKKRIRGKLNVKKKNVLYAPWSRMNTSIHL